MAERKESSNNIIGKILRRYFIDATGAMTLGIFASLIIGLIISQIAKIPGLSILNQISDVISTDSPVIGAAIGVAIAWGLKAKSLVVFSSSVTGAVGYAVGGPIGAYIGAVIGSELGGLIAGKTKLDIILTPIVTIITGGLVSVWVGPFISTMLTNLGHLINTATELSPILMGVVVAVLVGMCCTLPISAAAICIMISINGVAAGAAAVGCCCQMLGFAVISFKDNGINGLISQGLGTSMLQFPNILRHPQIWISPILASAILGPISTTLLGMTNTSVGAGMGSAGLVGQFEAYSAMNGDFSVLYTVITIIVMHFIAPILLTLGIDVLLRKLGWVKKGYMTIYKAS